MGKNYTLYIRFPEFQGELNKSGLINNLYEEHLKQVNQKVADLHTVGIDSNVEFKTVGNSFRTTITPNKDDVETYKKKIAGALGIKPCKHGYLPENCRYAKNGRPCK
jgi:hypothetical protein